MGGRLCSITAHSLRQSKCAPPGEASFGEELAVCGSRRASVVKRKFGPQRMEASLMIKGDSPKAPTPEAPQ